MYSKETRESENNEYLKAIKPTLYLMRLFFALPIQLQPQHGVPSFVSSKIVSFFVTVTCIIFHAYMIKSHYEMLFVEHFIDDIPTFVIKGVELMYELFILSIPLLMWNRSKEMQEYWEKWKIFQVKYEAVSCAPFVSRKTKYIRITSISGVSLILTLWAYSAWFYYDIYFGFFDFLVNNYLVDSSCIMFIYWYANCVYFQSLSEDILILAKEILAKKKSGVRINKVVLLWSNLGDLINLFIEAHSVMFLALLFIIINVIISNSYAIMNYSTFKDIYPFSQYIAVLSLCLVFLLVICETAHTVYHQINYRQTEALLQENLMNLTEISALASVLRFSQTISSYSPAINMNGFFTLSRSKFPLILALCINYLIVLRQFSEG